MQESNTSDAPDCDNAVIENSVAGPTEGVDSKKAQDSLSFGEMLTSTLWAALGVQNKKNRERDFTRGKATHFIYFGIGFTILFVLGMYALVSFVLSGDA